MAKRRNLLMGMAALAFGSGALSSVAAFSGGFARPESDFRVISDAGLRVRSARADGTLDAEPIVAPPENNEIWQGINNLAANDVEIQDGSDGNSFETSWSDFYSDQISSLIDDTNASPKALAAELNQLNNDELGLRIGVSTKLDLALEPFIEVENQTEETYNIKINYAENPSSSKDIDSNPSSDSQDGGYGDNVKTDTADYADKDLSNDKVSRKAVQTVFQWRLDGTDYGYNRNSAGFPSTRPGATGDGDLVSPDPTSENNGNPDEADNFFQLQSGEVAFIKLDINTTNNGAISNLIGQLNSVSNQNNTNPFSNSTNDNKPLVDLLDEVYVESEQP